MASLMRYLRLQLAFARFALANELAFRGNFLMKVLVELLWLGILLIFYQIIFKNTSRVAGWNEYQYLFFVGCYYTLEGLIETLFLQNCTEFADLVRSGNLDQYLLKPIDEQFLVSCRWFDWSTAPKLLVGGGVMTWALNGMHWSFNLGQLVAFLLLLACGTALAYSFLLMLTSTSVWFMRNQSLMELWWLLTTVMRYPREIYRGGWAGAWGRSSGTWCRCCWWSTCRPASWSRSFTIPGTSSCCSWPPRRCCGSAGGFSCSRCGATAAPALEATRRDRLHLGQQHRRRQGQRFDSPRRDCRSRTGRRLE